MHKIFRTNYIVLIYIQKGKGGFTLGLAFMAYHPFLYFKKKTNKQTNKQKNNPQPKAYNMGNLQKKKKMIAGLKVINLRRTRLVSI